MATNNPVYSIKQFVNSTQLNTTPGTVSAITPSFSDNTTDCQQIVCSFNENSLTPDTPYYFSVTMPQNKYYDFVYAVRLLNKRSSADEETLSEQNDFQLIKFITIPRISTVDTGKNDVVLFIDPSEEPAKLDGIDNQPIVHAAIQIELNLQPTIDAAITYIEGNENNHIEGHYSETQRANKLFVFEYGNLEEKNKCILWYDNDGNLKKYGDNNQNWTGKLKISEPQIIQHPISDDSSSKDDSATVEFIVTPEDSFQYMYFYLLPIPQDENIQWINNGHTYYGRHIEDIDKIKVKYGELTNILANTNFSSIKSFSVWGRSEQVMAINGQEIKIGPSGYYELNNYDVESICIANSAEGDKYTVDVQYIES